LLNFRKTSKALTKGKTLHFVPFDGVYVIFRMHEQQIVMLVLNKNEVSKSLQLNRFEELNLGGKLMKNIMTNEITTWKDRLDLPKMGAYLFEINME
jgi:hypothetical protein